MKKILYAIIYLLAHNLHGQLMGITETYPLNRLGINPAMASYDQKLRFNAIGQYGKANEIGSLKNYYLSVEMPILKTNGISVQYADYSNLLLKSNTINLGIAHHIKFSDKTSFSVGLSGGISNMKYDYESDFGISYVKEADKAALDPSSMASSKSTQSLNKFEANNYLLGAGIFLNVDKWHLGFGIPNIIKNKLPDSQDLTKNYQLERPAFLSIERDFMLHEKLKLVSGGLYRFSKLPIQKGLDLQASFWYNSKYSLGVWTQRIGSETFLNNKRPLLATAEIAIKNARLAYNFNINKATGYTNIKQQVMLRIDIDYVKKNKTL